MSGSVLYAKNWSRNERSAHENKPMNHILKVHTGRLGSSVLVTVSRTSSMGESSSSSPSVALMDLSAVEWGVCASKVPMLRGRSWS